MSLTDAYTAGLFDGEGTVTMARHRNHKTPNKFRRPVVSVSSTSLELLEFLRREHKGCIIKVTKRESHHKQAYIWTVVFDRARDFLKRVLPYLKEEEKIRRATLLIYTYPMITKRNGQYSVQEAKKRLEFEDTFFGDSVHPRMKR